MVDKDGNFRPSVASVEALAAKRHDLSAYQAMRLLDSDLALNFHNVTALLAVRGSDRVRAGLAGWKERLTADIPKFGEPAVHSQVGMENLS